jgi:23S rRNA pseudouridine2604 synthase
MKVDKYIGHSGFTSRQKAFTLIEEKRVSVNGKVATHSTKIQEGDIVLVDGKTLKVKTGAPTYIVYNKPKGVISTSEKVEGNIIDAIGHHESIHPIGRLDKESEGLILLSNVGEIMDKIVNPKYAHEKEYLVTLNHPVRKQFLDEVAVGVDIGGGITTKPCVIKAEPGTKRVFRIILKQGLNRQIRRVCNKYDYQVIKLQRVRVLNIKLGKLKLGEWRDLTEDELMLLLSQLK